MQLEAQAVEVIQEASGAIDITNAGQASQNTTAVAMETGTERQGIKTESRGTKRSADEEPAGLESSKKARTGVYFFPCVRIFRFDEAFSARNFAPTFEKRSRELYRFCCRSSK